MDKIEFKDKLVSINRITKVVKGGRRFAFSALVVVGNYSGSIGIGHGKAKQVPDAIKKATETAKNNLIKIPLREGRTLHHDVLSKDGAGKVLLRSAPSGTGIIAGGPIRAACEVVGIKDVVAKSLGSSNPMNVLRACLKGLRSQNSPKVIANLRGKKIGEVTKRKEE
jgi:small subunit ribosomal protein S5